MQCRSGGTAHTKCRALAVADHDATNTPCSCCATQRACRYGQHLAGLFKRLAEGSIKPPVVESLGALSAAVVSKMHARLAESSVQGKVTATVAAAPAK